MKNSILLLTASALLTGSFISAEVTIPDSQGTFEVGTGHFLYEGNPYIVKAAELHYPRIPKEYWEHRIKMCRALGLNTICLYVFWNIHESTPGEFDFEGQNDIRRFIELCREHDMKVILRPGPYVCAEWEMGGLPWWLLKEDDIGLRKGDPKFMASVERFERRLAEELSGMTAAEGGPIIMVQVENEYGSYGQDKEYISRIAELLKDLYPQTILFQCDWSSNFTLNGLPDLLWTMNFGTGADIDSQFYELKRLRPETPLMCSEFWSGWFDKWGANHETRPAEAMTDGIEEMLQKDISFSLYMTHGGTNFGHWAGANSPGFAPDVTSYDYDAPIDEQGSATGKYHLLREVLQNYSETELPPVPEKIPVMSIPSFEIDFVAPMDQLWGKPILDSIPRSMEKYDQGFGMIKYETMLPHNINNGDLLCLDPRDFVQVFANGIHIGTLDRRNGDNRLSLPDLKKGDKLSLIVEAMGRINFGTEIKDHKGMYGDVSVWSAGVKTPLYNWQINLMPDDYHPGALLYEVSQTTILPEKTKDREGVQRYPSGIYKGKFYLDKTSDTFLDLSAWGKGQVWVNGYPLGRFWEIGPQLTLYLPGAWLKKGENEIAILDIVGPRSMTLKGKEQPINNTLQNFGHNNLTIANIPEVNEEELLILYYPESINTWQRVKGDKMKQGSRLVLEVGESQNGATAISEINLIDTEGNRLSRNKWTGYYSSSSDTSHNRGIEKMFDLQESTYWEASDRGEQTLVIDLGEEKEIIGIEVLPRMESGAPGVPSYIKVYLTDE